MNEILYSLPNMALNDVPVGKDESFNKLIKKVGDIKIIILKLNLMLN